MHGLRIPGPAWLSSGGLAHPEVVDHNRGSIVKEPGHDPAYDDMPLILTLWASWQIGYFQPDMAAHLCQVACG